MVDIDQPLPTTAHLGALMQRAALSDGAAIQEAISQGPGRVMLEPRIHQISETIDLDSSSLILEGAGRATVLLAEKALGDRPILKIKGGVEDAAVRDMWFLGNGLGAKAIQVNARGGRTVFDLSLSGLRFGGYPLEQYKLAQGIDFAWALIRASLFNCRFYYCGDGLLFRDHAHGPHLSDCHFRYCDQGIRSDASGSGTEQVEGLAIHHSLFKCNKHYHIGGNRIIWTEIETTHFGEVQDPQGAAIRFTERCNQMRIGYSTFLMAGLGGAGARAIDLECEVLDFMMSKVQLHGATDAQIVIAPRPSKVGRHITLRDLRLMCRGAHGVRVANIGYEQVLLDNVEVEGWRRGKNLIALENVRNAKVAFCDAVGGERGIWLRNCPQRTLVGNTASYNSVGDIIVEPWGQEDEAGSV